MIAKVFGKIGLNTFPGDMLCKINEGEARTFLFDTTLLKKRYKMGLYTVFYLEEVVGWNEGGMLCQAQEEKRNIE